MGRRHLIILFVLFGSSILAYGMQAPKASRENAGENAEFQWLDGLGETVGIGYATRQLRPLSLQTFSGPRVEIEREQVRLDPQTTRIVSRTFSTSANGERRLIETTEEEIKKTGEGAMSAVRTTSRPDVNGRMRIESKETQEVAPSSADTYRIVKTVLLPGINGALVEKENVQQIERRKGDSLVEIDRVRYEPGADGRWNAVDRRVSRNQLGKDQLQTDEQVYRYDVNNKLSLTQQVRVSESSDTSGQKRLESETFDIGMNGKLQLSSRSTMVQKDLGRQGREVSEIIESSNPASLREGLKVVRKIVESAQQVGSDQTKRKLEVLAPNLNGGMQSIYTQYAIDNK